MFVAPEQVHLWTIQSAVLGRWVAQKRNPVAAPGQHDQRLPLAATAGPDLCQLLICGRDQNVAIGEDLDATAHRYCTFDSLERGAADFVGVQPAGLRLALTGYSCAPKNQSVGLARPGQGGRDSSLGRRIDGLAAHQLDFEFRRLARSH